MLILGIKRRLPRLKDADAKKADSTFKAVRGKILDRDSYRCTHCGYKGKNHSQVHHVDDNHHNNKDENLVTICHLCHPYHHVGEAARPNSIATHKEGHLQPKAAALIRVPKEYKETVTAEDLNRLMRAIGIALSDPNEKAVAQQIYRSLATTGITSEFAKALFGEESGLNMVRAEDMAAGMSYLTKDEYAKRGEVIDDVRLIFNPSVLTQWGRLWKGGEIGLLNDPSQWSRVLEEPLKNIESMIEEEAKNSAEADDVTDSMDDEDDYDEED